MRLVWLVVASMWAGMGTQGYAQKAIGSVSSADAVVSGAGGLVNASDGRVTLNGSSTVTAKDHTAPVKLARGGEAWVCQTSALHLAAAGDDSLLLALDRGAIEIRMKAKAGDVVMTPDLRFTLGKAGPLELEMRVMGNGDTCVDNRGHRAPTLKITDAFGEANYELKPGQHVTFEHGSLREVVDRETMPCGCPPDERKSGSLADAALASGSKGKPVTPEQAAAAHPFPAAVSEGLAPPTPTPAETPGQTHVQVATTLAFDPGAARPAASAEASPVQETQAPVVQPVAQKKSSGEPLGAVGRFFKRLFVR
jgi:hypothetical protein